MFDLPAFLIVADGLGIAALVGDGADFPLTVIGVADGVAVGIGACGYVACTVVGILLPSAFCRLHAQDAPPAVHGIACPVPAAVHGSCCNASCIVGNGLGGLSLFPAPRRKELSLFVLYAVAAADLYAVPVRAACEAVLSVVLVSFGCLPVLPALYQVTVDVVSKHTLPVPFIFCREECLSALHVVVPVIRCHNHGAVQLLHPCQAVFQVVAVGDLPCLSFRSLLSDSGHVARLVVGESGLQGNPVFFIFQPLGDESVAAVILSGDMVTFRRYDAGSVAVGIAGVAGNCHLHDALLSLCESAVQYLPLLRKSSCLIIAVTDLTHNAPAAVFPAGNGLLLADAVPSHVIAVGYSCPEAVLHPHEAVSGIISEGQGEILSCLLLCAVFRIAAAVTYLLYTVPVCIIGIGCHAAADVSRAVSHGYQLPGQSACQVVGIMTAVSVRVRLRDTVPPQVVGIGLFHGAVGRGHGKQAAFFIIGIGIACAVVTVFVILSGQHVFHHVSCPVIEEAFHAAVGMAGAQHPVLPVVVVPGAFPVPRFGIVGVGMHFFNDVPFPVAELFPVAAVSINGLGQAV